MWSVTFSTETEGPRRVRTATVGHAFECADGIWRKVLSIAAGPYGDVAIVLADGFVELIAAGSVLRTKDTGRRVPSRTEKPAVPAPAVLPVSVGLVCGVDYHSGPFGKRTIMLDDYDGNRLVVSFGRGDPVTLGLLDVHGVVTSKELCGLGSVSKWHYSSPHSPPSSSSTRPR